MKAAILNGINNIEVKEIDTPKVAPGTILIKIDSCAVCGSDVRIMSSGNDRVKYPAILGHEISGEVIETGVGVYDYRAGDKISVGADVPCGECHFCLNDMGNCCQINYAMGYQFSGGFAEYCLLDPVVVKYGPVAKIPQDKKLETLALAEPLGCCINGLERLFFKPGGSALIIGAGPIGILLARLLKHKGAKKVVIAEQSYARLKYAKSLTDAVVIDTNKKGLTKASREILPEGFNYIFTACPVPLVQEEATGLLAMRGAINFFGGLAKNSPKILIDSNDIHYGEKYITGSHGSIPRQFTEANDLICSGDIEVDDLITHRFSLDEIEKGLDTVRNKEGLKVLIKP